MEFCLNNEKLCVRVSSLGAELRSVRGADGTEYLWQGDERFWRGRATNIFPYVGRLTEDSYLWRGARYKMGRHGFARGSEFTAEAATDTRLILSLRAGEATRESYPFDFKFSLIYELSGDTLRQTYCVENRGEGDMPFGLGGHPGFNVPLAEVRGLPPGVFRALRAAARPALAPVLRLRRGSALRARKQRHTAPPRPLRR